MKAFITNIAGFLPNAPVDNDHIEEVLGMVAGKPSRSRKLVLRNNKIKTRYYAIDPVTGEFTHNTAQLAAEAIRALMAKSGNKLEDMTCLCVGTTSPDLMIPSHGSMVHGELQSPPCEVYSAGGVCTSSISALKHAALSVASGDHDSAVSVGSEFSSRFMRSKNFEPEIDAKIEALEAKPELAFEKDFLRWMLSDGAGAVLVESKPKADGLSLAIDFIDYVSYAGEMPVCMYSGGNKREDGSMKSWENYDNPMDIIRTGVKAIKQDARILNEQILPVTVGKGLSASIKKHNLKVDEIDWFLPHYSSGYFRDKLDAEMEGIDFKIPEEKWFTNLYTVGNVGSASMFLIIDELVNSGKLKKGDRLLCYIPESARFSVSYMHLTVV
jgi:3-oxoacyl-[acyl-carrier-protein] synthase-3